MKLVTYNNQSKEKLGVLVNQEIFCISEGANSVADNMLDLLQKGKDGMQKVKEIHRQILANNCSINPTPISACELLAPLTNPTSLRDAYAFRQHVETARRNRGVGMVPEFDQFPVFYFSNHHAIQGPYDNIECMPDHFEKLDYELEVAIVIGKKGRNIKAEEADAYIAGFMIMNDFSARQLQMEEMRLSLGPAKGKDFSTVIGPYLVTTDELKDFEESSPSNHTGKMYNLEMKCWVNGTLLSFGNLNSMHWTFAEIIERCSYGVDLHPGDIIGSGTVGTGCLLELNGTNKLGNSKYTEQWLKEGDIVEMEISHLGRIKNRITKSASKNSLLAIKKSII